MIAPDGKKERFEYRGLASDAPLFSGTHLYDLQWSYPKQGKWRVQIQGRKGAAFFLISSFSSMNQEVIRLQSTEFCQKIANVQVKLQLPDYWKPNQSFLQMFTDSANKNKYPSAQIKELRELKKSSQGEAFIEFKLPRKEAVQTIHFQMNGESKYGSKMRRDYVTSIYL
ncbi:hypothetical protein [Tepidibacillus marianensis]|uniref:hypothetical protein n=1 Tax=Tepidibacillus marianensis TaxID=3131995 RepID=UPI0030D2C26A